MSGVFGVLDSKRNTQIAQLLAQMGTKMSHREWYVVETHRDEGAGVGLGRIGIGIFKQERQLVCSEDQNQMVFLSGEFYHTAELRRDLKAKGHHFRDESDLELLLRLYQDKGKQFIHDLDGTFVLAIWDLPKQRLIIANDRFGLYPLYFAHYDGKLIFAPETKGVLWDPHFRKELDLTALAEYMRFQQLVGQKSFFERLQLFPNASVLSYQLETDQLDITSYWEFSEVPALPENVSYEEVMEEGGRLLRQVVNRLTSGSLGPGVCLSGGRDSRLILGLVDRENFPIVSITYGTRNCRDVVYADKIARQAGSNHHWLEFKDGNWVRDYADFHLELTEGFHSWIHSHGIGTLHKAWKLMGVNLTGWGVDYGVGGHWGDALLIEAASDLAFVTRLFYLYNQRYTWAGIGEAEERFLYQDSFYPQVESHALASLKWEAERLSHHDFPRRAEFFDQLNHDMRMTANALIFMRSHFEIRYPAYDYRLYDFVCSIPMKLRMGGKMERDLISRLTPPLARIPWEKDDALPTRNRLIRGARALYCKVKNRFNPYIFPLFPQRPRLYVDYENFLRGELREWAESILFDKRTLGRGIFKPQFIRSIWARHLSGRELHTIGRIAPIMTYEMMLRKFFD